MYSARSRSSGPGSRAETDRRGFLWLLGATTAWLWPAAAPARARETALEIHRETRNTRLRAIGARLARSRTPPGRTHEHAGAERVPLFDFPSQPALSLARAVRAHRPAVGFEPVALSLGELTRLLFLTNGVTGEGRFGAGRVLLRAAPSAGALYAGEVYVVVRRVRGLAAGVYAYQVEEHALARLGEGDRLGEVERALAQPARASAAAAVVLLTNVFERYEHRYANRGYRYALIDTGHIGENLRLAATSAGLAECAALRFEDGPLNALLGVDGREEAVCAVHAVGRPRAAPLEPGPQRPLAERQDVAGDADLPDAPTRRFHAATALVRGSASILPSPPPEPGLARSRGSALPARERDPAGVVDATIRQRRSARAFQPAPLSAADLAFVLEMAAGQPALRRADGVDLHLFVHRVAGLAPGLYRHVEGRRLVLDRAGDLSGELEDACLGQDKAARAAVGFALVGRLAEAAARGGDRSYRDLLIEAGGVAQRIYLAAEALGVAARNLASFTDDALNALLGVDGTRRAALHLTVLGPGD